MPTPNQISKQKSALILAEEANIKSRIELIQQNIYDLILPDLKSLANNKKLGRPYSLNTIFTKFKKAYGSQFPDVMKLTSLASNKVTDLNEAYFSSLMDSNRIEEIAVKTRQVVSKRLGVTQSGKLITNGFTDKVIGGKKAQNDFIKTINQIVTGNPDVNKMQLQIKDYIIGNKETSGNLERYYRTTSQDIVIGIDRNNSLIYADDLDLNDFIYGGGLITTSRSFCIERNGKVFSRSQAEKWKSSSFIKKMYKSSQYDPLIDMGGYGCRHTPDWITSDVADEIRGKQNKKATQRNKDFVDKNNL